MQTQNQKAKTVKIMQWLDRGYGMDDLDLIFLAFSWVIGMMAKVNYTRKTVNLTEQPEN